MRRIPKLFELNAFSITLFYLIFAVLWILLSDQFLIWITNDPLLISKYQTVKGLFYVFCTAGFLYYLIYISNDKISIEKKRVDEALYAANMATWSIDLESEEIARSEFHHKLFGFNKKPRGWSLKNFLQIIHPEDREKVQNELERTIQKESSGYQVQFRIIWPDDSIHWMLSRGNLVKDEQGNTIHVAGVIADITEQKKLEEDYERKKELFENVFQHIPIMIDITTDDFKAIRVNKAYEEITGWSQEEVRNRDIMHLVYPDEDERKKAETAIKEADGSWNEFTTYTKSGEKRIQQWANIELSDGSSIGIGLDVTEKRKLEQEHELDRQELQKVYDNIPVFVSLYKGRREIHRVNKYFEDVLGYKNEDLNSADMVFELIPDREDRVKAEKHLDKADGSWLDFKLTTKSGEVIDTTWTVINVTGSLKMGIGLDTTELKQKERELEELTARYKNAEKMAQLGHWKRDLETNEAVVSEGFYDIVEVDTEETDFTFELLKQVIYDEDWEKFSESLDHAIKTGGIDFEYRVTGQKSGKIKYIHELGTVEYDEEGNPQILSGTVQDITEAKITQSKIRESRELLKKTFESLKESVIILDPKTRLITDCNSSTQELFGYTAEELKGSSTKILHVDEEHFKKFGEIGADDLQNHGFFKTEFEMKRKDGTRFYSDHTVSLVKNEEGETEKIVSVIRDITERKKYERELKKLADRYRRAEEIAGFGHWRRNVKTDEAIWSEGFYNVIGLEPGERDTSYQSLLEMIHPDDREEFDSAFKNALETGSLNIRYRLIKPSTGEVGYYHELAQTTYDDDGNPEFVSGTIQDMTELEEFQIKLHRRNKFIETTLENLPIGVAVNLIDSGKATLMNSMFSEIYGWPKEMLKEAQTFFEKVYPDESYRSKIIEMVTADIASENPNRMQWKGVKIVTQEGEEKIINAKNIPVYEQNLMISTVVDVTAQFKAEQRLAESEHNYRLLFQKSPLPMWIYNPENFRFIEVNNAAIQHYGYSRKEFQEMTILDIRPEEDRQAVKQEVRGRIENKISDSKEWRHLKKNGEVIYVNITGSEIDYFGHHYRLILVNDVTEQKKAEEMVLASLVEGENKERARIARELHDGLGQYLAAANMNLDSLQGDIEKLSERKQKQFQKGLTLLKHAVSETAQISRNLLPRVVEDYGLALAIEALVDNYSSNTEIEITYYQNIKGLKLERKIELNLYRIAQEAISNAVKYSKATKINVQLIKDELDLILSIDDNGKGFDKSAKDFTPGLGLQTIKTRTSALGGEFELDTKPGKGTFIHIIVPVKNKIDN